MSDAIAIRIGKARALSVAVVWLAGLVVGLVWRDLGSDFVTAVIVTVCAGTVTAWMMTAERAIPRDPILKLFVPLVWPLYFLCATVMAFVPGAFLSPEWRLFLPLIGRYIPPEWSIVAQVVLLGVVALIHTIEERSVGQIDQENHARHEERKGMKELQAAALRLKLDASLWPLGDQRPAVDALLRSMQDALRFAPARVPPELASVVVDAATTLEAAAEKFRNADGQAAEWFVRELEVCDRRVKALVQHVESLMSVGRA